MRKIDYIMKKLLVLCVVLCVGVLKTQAEEFSIRVMSYNIYRGGTMRGHPLSQTAKVIREAKADIVGLQEPKSPRGFNTEKLANLLGWNHSANIRKGIVSLARWTHGYTKASGDVAACFKAVCRPTGRS